MARPKTVDDLRKYALLGAQTRLMALRDEMQFILDRFPELTGDTHQEPVGRPSGAAAPVKVRRWEMSAEAKKAVSVRMKKYWAARRRAKAAATKSGAPAKGAKG